LLKRVTGFKVTAFTGFQLNVHNWDLTP